MTEIDKLPTLIGRRISELRRQRGLSLSELARLAGISKSTLSELESGRINPTIGTLWSIARALGIGFGELVEPLRELCGEEVCVQLLKKFHDVEVYLMQIRKGVTYISSPHPENTVEYVIVLKGVLLCGTIGQSRIVEPGSIVKFMADKSHIYASFNEDVICIVIVKYTHMFAKPNTILEVDAPDRVQNIVRRLVESFDVSSASYHILIKGTRESPHDILDSISKLSRAGIKVVHIKRDTNRYSIFLFNRYQLRDLSWIISNNEGLSGKLRELVRLMLEILKGNKNVYYLTKLAENCEDMFRSLLIVEYLAFNNISVIPESVEIFYKNLMEFLGNNIMIFPLINLLNPGAIRQMLLVLYYVLKLIESCRNNVSILFVDEGYGYPVKIFLDLLHENVINKIGITYICNSDAFTGFVKSYLREYSNVLVTSKRNVEDLHDKKFNIIILFNLYNIMDMLNLFDKYPTLIEDCYHLIIADEMIPPFNSWLSRVKIMLLHHLTYALDTIVDVDSSSLSDDEIKFVSISKMCCVDTLHEVLSRRVTRGLSLFLKYYNDLVGIIDKLHMYKLSSLSLLYNLVHYLRFSSLRASLNGDRRIMTIDYIVSAVTSRGFVPSTSCRVYPSYGGGGSYVLTFKRE